MNTRYALTRISTRPTRDGYAYFAVLTLNGDPIGEVEQEGYGGQTTVHRLPDVDPAMFALPAMTAGVRAQYPWVDVWEYLGLSDFEDMSIAMDVLYDVALLNHDSKNAVVMDTPEPGHTPGGVNGTMMMVPTRGRLRSSVIAELAAVKSAAGVAHETFVWDTTTESWVPLA